jgi:intracellular septation protein A
MNQAVLVTLILCLALLVSWAWRPPRAPEGGVLMLLIAYAFLGGWMLWFALYSPLGQEPAALGPWKPTVMYWTLAGIMLVAPVLGWGYPVKAIFGTFFVLPKKQWRWINWGFAAFYALLGGVNLALAFNTSEDNWLGFKYACMMNLLFLILFRVNFVWYPTLIKVALDLYGRVTASLQ